jgi:uroporphyrinogen decarboxylase
MGTNKGKMNCMERVMSALSFKEPDRVPLFLALTMHGAKELGLSLKDYFSSPQNIFEAQVKMQKKYSNDFYYGIYYGPIEVEILGGEIIFSEDGPPNSGDPLINSLSDIKNLNFPEVNKCKRLREVLKAINLMKEYSKGKIPILGIVMSPFSVPVMQMGFDKYIELIYQGENYFDELMDKNKKFCIEWANAQLDAGATAIGYFDPVSSSTIVTREQFIKTGYIIAKDTVKNIKGPVAMHFASGRCMDIIDLLPDIKIAMAGVSVLEDLSKLKAASFGKFSLAGNLNGIEMRRWTPGETVEIVREAIIKGGPGGGFVLSDNHGEIPYTVSEEVLLGIAETVKKYGNYPIIK